MSITEIFFFGFLLACLLIWLAILSIGLRNLLVRQQAIQDVLRRHRAKRRAVSHGLENLRASHLRLIRELHVKRFFSAAQVANARPSASRQSESLDGKNPLSASQLSPVGGVGDLNITTLPAGASAMAGGAA